MAQEKNCNLTKEEIDALEGHKCTCDLREYELHTCPYQMDVNNECDLPEEEQSLCDCCPCCEYNCAMDI